MKLNLPNIITLSRIIISPVFFFLILSADPLIQQLACLLFMLGAITDSVDGWYARRYNEVTEWGKFVDPLADKFLTTAAFLAFVFMRIIPLWMVIIVIIRDFGTTILRIYAEKKHIKMKTSFTAKTKTSLQMLFIAYILSLIFIKNANTSVTDPNYMSSWIYSPFTYYSMFLITVITVWSMIEYLLVEKELTNSMKQKFISSQKQSE